MCPFRQFQKKKLLTKPKTHKNQPTNLRQNAKEDFLPSSSTNKTLSTVDLQRSQKVQFLILRENELWREAKRKTFSTFEKGTKDGTRFGPQPQHTPFLDLLVGRSFFLIFFFHQIAEISNYSSWEPGLEIGSVLWRFVFFCFFFFFLKSSICGRNLKRILLTVGTFSPWKGKFCGAWPNLVGVWESGKVKLLIDFRRCSKVLKVLFSCTARK